MAIATAMSGDGDDIFFSGDALNVLVEMRERERKRERNAGRVRDREMGGVKRTRRNFKED